MNESKSPLASKTILLNGVALAAAALTALANHELVAANPRATAWLVAALGFLNVVNRFFTSAPIALPK